jgi:transaldolase
MTTNALHELRDHGQSPWLDSITREWLDDGTLARWVDELAVTGVTSNPSIFANALASSTYDDEIRTLAEDGLDDRAIFERLATDDIRRACDVLKSVYESTGGIDGRVSIELEPDLAHDTDASIARAHELWKLVDRPNVLIKVPATEEGLPVIESLLTDGIDVNVTLLFSVEMYREVMERHLRALERRMENGDSLDVVSVASFFVSRIDTAVDPQIEQSGDTTLRTTLGKCAVANAVVAWEAHQSTYAGERWQHLADAGAQPQRPLWASTGTKNPAYSDVLYVDELIVPGTVNTMPLATMKAFADHGNVRSTIDDKAIERAQSTLAAARNGGIDLAAVTADLLVAGVNSFQASFDELLALIANRRERVEAH